MTRALCIRCGSIKFGAFCDCMHCGGRGDPDRSLAIELSDHRLSIGALERLGAVVRDIAAATPDGDLRRAALLELFRERFPDSFHRVVPPALAEPARAILASIKLPTVNLTGPTELEQWTAILHRTAMFGRRLALCRLVHDELARNPAVASAELAHVESPDLVIDPETMEVASTGPTVVTTESGDREAAHRATTLARVLAFRRTALLRVGAIVALRQRAYLLGDDPRPGPLAPAELEIGPYVLRHATLRCNDRDHELGTLIDSGRVTAPELAAVEAKLRELIAAEDPHAPHSDQRLAGLLANAGLSVARRVVARCRERLQIPPASRRRRI